MVALLMVLSVTTFTLVAKADAYEYENIQELTDEVAKVISKKDTYNFKFEFHRDDYFINLDTNVNWKKMTVTFNGYIYRPEKRFKKEKFSATLNLRNNKVKTSSKAYRKGRNTLSDLLSLWNCDKSKDEYKSVGHYLLGVFQVMGKYTIVGKSDNKVTLVQEAEYTNYAVYSKAVINESNLLKLEIEDSNHTVGIKLK